MADAGRRKPGREPIRVESSQMLGTELRHRETADRRQRVNPHVLLVAAPSAGTDRRFHRLEPLGQISANRLARNDIKKARALAPDPATASRFVGEVRQAVRDLLCEQTPALDAVASALEEGAVMSAEELTFGLRELARRVARRVSRLR